jgi:hypothetical protein
MKVSDFGDALWGSGVAEAQDRTTKITREKLIQMGVTHELAQAWYDFLLNRWHGNEACRPQRRA